MHPTHFDPFFNLYVFPPIKKCHVPFAFLFLGIWIIYMNLLMPSLCNGSIRSGRSSARSQGNLFPSNIWIKITFTAIILGESSALNFQNNFSFSALRFIETPAHLYDDQHGRKLILRKLINLIEENNNVGHPKSQSSVECCYNSCCRITTMNTPQRDHQFGESKLWEFPTKYLSLNMYRLSHIASTKRQYLPCLAPSKGEILLDEVWMKLYWF